MTDPTDLFDQPSGSQFPLDEHIDSLLLVWATDFEAAVPTVHGESDAVRARILVVDGDDAGEEFDDVLLFPRVLVSTLKGKVGSNRPTLGRLAQGEAKRGQSAPWILAPFTEEDAAAAVAAMSGTFASAEEEPAAEAPKKAPARRPAAKAAPKVEIAADKKALAETLLASDVPDEAIAQATGYSVEQLQAAEILPH